MDEITKAYLRAIRGGYDFHVQQLIKTAKELEDQKQYQRAFKLWKKGAEDYGDFECIDNLGQCYQYGHGCQKDLEKARECYQSIVRYDFDGQVQIALQIVQEELSKQ